MTKYSKKKDIFYSNPGFELTDDYAYEYDSDGYKHLEISGHTNLQQKIQANKDYCSISMLVSRFLDGDESALDRVKGFYADVTCAPKSYMDMVKRIEDSRKVFDSLDPEIKKKFGSNADEFWSLYGTAEFAERLGQFEAEKLMDEVPDVIEEEVKE